MEDAIGSALNSATERVVSTIEVVVPHLASRFLYNSGFRVFNSTSWMFFDSSASWGLYNSTTVDIDFDSGLVWASRALLVDFTGV